MRKALIAGTLVLAALYPAAAGAATFKGTVVSSRHASHVLVVSSNTGLVRTVHTSFAARAGSVVSVNAAVRADGTFMASRVSVVGHARKAHIRGVVVARAHGITFVSGNRSVLAVHSRRVLASAGTGTPLPGTVANIGVTIAATGTLTQTSATTVGKSSNIVIQATVDSITPATATTPGSLVLKIGTETFTIPLAAGMTLPAAIVQGATVSLTISFGDNGATATGDDDENDDNDNGDNGGDGSGSGSGSGSSGSSG
jgi:hypothetical protein